MEHLRQSDLFIYMQNYMNHKNKVHKILNKSMQSIRQISEFQDRLRKTNQSSHERSERFKIQQKLRTINQQNEKMVSRMLCLKHANNKNSKLTLLTNYSPNRYGGGLAPNSSLQSLELISRTRENMMRNSLQIATSRIKSLNEENAKIAKVITSVKSTISLSQRSLKKDWETNCLRSSMLSKYKVDTKGFKFIPKNEIILKKFTKVEPLKQIHSHSRYRKHDKKEEIKWEQQQLSGQSLAQNGQNTVISKIPSKAYKSSTNINKRRTQALFSSLQRTHEHHIHSISPKISQKREKTSLSKLQKTSQIANNVPLTSTKGIPQLKHHSKEFKRRIPKKESENIQEQIMESDNPELIIPFHKKNNRKSNSDALSRKISVSKNIGSKRSKYESIEHQSQSQRIATNLVRVKTQSLERGIKFKKAKFNHHD